MFKENDDFILKKDSFAKALNALSEQPVRTNESKRLIAEYYLSIKELLAKGHRLTEIARQISMATGISEATFKKNYHLLKNEKKITRKGKSKSMKNKQQITTQAHVNDVQKTENTVAEKFVKKHKDEIINTNFNLLSEDI